MLLKSLHTIPSFEAGDKTILKEVLHPKNDQLSLNYSLAYAKLPVGRSSLLHRLKQSEVYVILEGEGKIFVNSKGSIVRKGDVVFVPPQAKQYLENQGETELQFLCIVSPPWSPEEEWILDNGK